MPASRLPELLTRRHALRAGAGLAAMMSTVARDSTVALDDSPQSTPAAVPAWLFVMTFQSADMNSGGASPAGTLTLAGVHEHVVAFTDRPVRDVSLLSVDEMVGLINDAASIEQNPLNATLAAPPVQGQEPELVVMVLHLASWSPEDQTVTMEVAVTGGEHHGTPVTLEQAIEERWTDGFLFIDPSISRSYDPTPDIGG